MVKCYTYATSLLAVDFTGFYSLLIFAHRDNQASPYFTTSLMLSPAYKIPKFVLAVASKLTKLEAPNLRMLSLYSIYIPIPILMCVGLIVAQLVHPVFT